MSKPHHTPTPWTLHDLGPHPRYPDWHTYTIRETKTNVCLAVVGHVDRWPYKHNRANATLMVSAPELWDKLDKLQRTADAVLGFLNANKIGGDHAQKLCKAIADAQAALYPPTK